MGSEPNWENRTLMHGDNLEFLRGMNSNTIHLIATDPPFNKSKDFHATPDSLAAGASFQDRWSWERDIHQEWLEQISDDYPNVMEVIKNSRKTYGDDMGAFLCFMAVRLLEMRRVLRKDGSIYLHCDPTASHYLKMLMDGIFGKKNFRNEIIWKYGLGGSSRRFWSRKHDVLLFYTKSGAWHFDKPFEPATSNRMAGEMKGMTDVWDIPTINNMAKERTGYPTQKPLELYKRIIKASSQEENIVLDPFAGCATTLVAAERHGRNWVGIDLWDKAHDLVVERLKEAGLLAGPGGDVKSVLPLEGDIKLLSSPPERTDEADVAADFLDTPTSRKKELWERLTHKQIMEHLQDAQRKGGMIVCAGCGRELEKEFMELDHIRPRAGGGSNDITNRILLCRPCNGKKSSDLTMPGLIKRNRKEKWMLNENAAKVAQKNAERMAINVRKGQLL